MTKSCFSLCGGGCSEGEEEGSGEQSRLEGKRERDAAEYQ